MNQSLLTVEDVASYFSVSDKTVYSWVGKGLIPHYKLGGKVIRFKEKEVAHWVESQKHKKFAR
jgi:excisionase family DNA binding protein